MSRFNTRAIALAALVFCSADSSWLWRHQALAQVMTGAQETQRGRPMPAIPDTLTMEQKVAASHHVFVGTGRRVYFVDKFYKEVPYEQAFSSSQSDIRSAVVEVAVDQQLYPESLRPASALFHHQASMIARGDQPSGFERLVKEYVGKRLIYFSVAERYPLYSEPVDGGKAIKLGESPTIHRLLRLPARRGPVDNPLALSSLEEVRRSVNKRIEGESKTGRGNSASSK